MFEGGLRGFFDDIVNTVRCIEADATYKISKIKNSYYDKYDVEEQQDASQQDGAL